MHKKLKGILKGICISLFSITTLISGGRLAYAHWYEPKVSLAYIIATEKQFGQSDKLLQSLKIHLSGMFHANAENEQEWTSASKLKEDINEAKKLTEEIITAIEADEKQIPHSQHTTLLLDTQLKNYYRKTKETVLAYEAFVIKLEAIVPVLEKFEKVSTYLDLSTAEVISTEDFIRVSDEYVSRAQVTGEIIKLIGQSQWDEEVDQIKEMLQTLLLECQDFFQRAALLYLQQKQAIITRSNSLIIKTAESFQALEQRRDQTLQTFLHAKGEYDKKVRDIFIGRLEDLSEQRSQVSAMYGQIRREYGIEDR